MVRSVRLRDNSCAVPQNRGIVCSAVRSLIPTEWQPSFGQFRRPANVAGRNRSNPGSLLHGFGATM